MQVRILHTDTEKKGKIVNRRTKIHIFQVGSSPLTLSSRRTCMGEEEMSKKIWAKDYIEKIEKGQWKYVMRVLATGMFNMRIVDG